MAVLAGNLDRFRHAIWDAFPGTVVGWIGDTAHMASCSDHNEDDCGVVHAIDPMVAAGTEAAAAIVNAAVGRSDLQYVIHNRTIWAASTGWAPHEYTGSDPHDTHVHISGRHGSLCYSARTCTGYSRVAETNQSAWVLALPQTVFAAEEAQMLSDTIATGFAFDETGNYLSESNVISVPLIQVGSGPYANAWLWFAGSTALIRVGIHNVNGAWDWHDLEVAFSSGRSATLALPTNTDGLKIGRKRRTATDVAADAPVRWTIAYAPNQ